LLRATAAQQGRRLPVRDLFARAMHAAMAVKPCLVMSPADVSRLLPPELVFDVVIIDEASRVPVPDAITCAYRGNALVICGDDRQLPAAPIPGGDPRSILELALGCGAFRVLDLTTHYRSRDESLIAFANHAFYQGRLTTFPAFAPPGPDAGVQLYPAGGDLSMAELVATRVAHHLVTRPELSLGVVVCTAADAAEIEAAVADMVVPPEDDRLRGFFIKDLDAVQGDERDVVIFAIGADLGGLAGPDGWRRLNVATTRARRRLEVISAVRARDLPADDSRLADFLDYAARGIAALNLDTEPEPIESQTPFEDSVRDVIRGWGYRVQTRVGAGAFRIDIAVRRSARRNAPYALGIECDGTTYDSAPTARDRDRIREQVLHGLGWRLHRVWGTAWYLDREREETRLRAAIEDAFAALPEESDAPELTTATPVATGAEGYTAGYTDAAGAAADQEPFGYEVSTAEPDPGVERERVSAEELAAAVAGVSSAGRSPSAGPVAAFTQATADVVEPEIVLAWTDAGDIGLAEAEAAAEADLAAAHETDGLRTPEAVLPGHDDDYDAPLTAFAEVQHLAEPVTVSPDPAQPAGAGEDDVARIAARFAAAQAGAEELAVAEAYLGDDLTSSVPPAPVSPAATAPDAPAAENTVRADWPFASRAEDPDRVGWPSAAEPGRSTGRHARPETPEPEEPAAGWPAPGEEDTIRAEWPFASRAEVPDRVDWPSAASSPSVSAVRWPTADLDETSATIHRSSRSAIADERDRQVSSISWPSADRDELTARLGAAKRTPVSSADERTVQPIEWPVATREDEAAPQRVEWPTASRAEPAPPPAAEPERQVAEVQWPAASRDDEPAWRPAPEQTAASREDLAEVAARFGVGTEELAAAAAQFLAGLHDTAEPADRLGAIAQLRTELAESANLHPDLADAAATVAEQALRSTPAESHRPAWYQAIEGQPDIAAAVAEFEETMGAPPGWTPAGGTWAETAVDEARFEGAARVAHAGEWAQPYRKAGLAPLPPGAVLTDPALRPDLIAAVRRLAEIEGPVHISLALQRMREEWGLARIARPARAAIEDAIEQAGVAWDGTFLGDPDQAHPVVRYRAEGVARKADQIADAELAVACENLVIDGGMLSVDELLAAVTKLYGWSTRRSTELDARLTGLLADLVAEGHLLQHPDGLAAAHGLPDPVSLPHHDAARRPAHHPSRQG
ncbi:regulator, partial [Actinoplanes octamycinicus]